MSIELVNVVMNVFANGNSNNLNNGN